MESIPYREGTGKAPRGGISFQKDQGPVDAHESLVMVDSNAIVGNQADAASEGRGGGVRLAFCPAFTITNNVIARNYAEDYASGVGVAVSTGSIAHNTIADNTGGDGSGVRVSSGSATALYGNIILGHTVGITNTDWPASTVQAEYTLFEANLNDYGPGVTSLNEIPGSALLKPDYHLSVGSGAIDQVPPLAWVAWDIDGDSRPVGAASEAGADEILILHAYLPLVLRGVP